MSDLPKINKTRHESKKPTPYRWVKNQKLKIPEGATFRDDKCITIRQCASWISEYNKVNESQCNDIVPKHILYDAWQNGAKWSEDAMKGNATVPFSVWLEDNYPEYTKQIKTTLTKNLVQIWATWWNINIMRIKLISIEHNKESFIQDNYTDFILTYEIKKWYYFGRIKTKIEHINIENSIAMDWLMNMKQEIKMNT